MTVNILTYSFPVGNTSPPRLVTWITCELSVFFCYFLWQRKVSPHLVPLNCCPLWEYYHGKTFIFSIATWVCNEFYLFWKIDYDKNIRKGHSSFVGFKTCIILFSGNKLVHVFDNSFGIMSNFVNYFKLIYVHFKFNSYSWYQIRVNYKLMTWTSIFLYKELE